MPSKVQLSETIVALEKELEKLTEQLNKFLKDGVKNDDPRRKKLNKEIKKTSQQLKLYKKMLKG